VAGAWYLATYGSDDNSSPSLAVLEQNFLFYLWGGPGSQYNWTLWVSLVGFVGLTITTHRSATPVSWMRTLMAAALIWGTSTAYFLTHKIAIPYYQIPAMFAVLVLLALSGLTRQVLHDKPQERGDGIPSRRSWNVIARLAGAMAFLPGLAALEIAWAARPQAPLSAEVSPHQVVLPPELTAPSAWVYADLMTGSLWYYAEKPSYKILFADGATRAQAYRFAFERGEPQYVIRDSEGMQSAIAEIERMGAILIPRGMVDNYPYFLVRWPATGPRSEHLLNRQ
jgi:hypothetical protein